MDKKNLAIIRQAFANAALGHKINEVAASRKATAVSWFKWADVIIVSIVLALFLLQSAFSSTSLPILGYIGAGLSAAEIVLLIVKQMYHFDEDVVSHKNAAGMFLVLRDQYRSLISDVISRSIQNTDVIKRRDALSHEYQLISRLSLPTTDSDYKEALDKMKIKPDTLNIWSDKQIDQLLPTELRKK